MEEAKHERLARIYGRDFKKQYRVAFEAARERVVYVDLSVHLEIRASKSLVAAYEGAARGARPAV